MSAAEDVARPASGGQRLQTEGMRPDEQAVRRSWATQPIELIGCLPGAERVDLIFVNGNIYTVNERQPHAEAIAVKKDRIAFVGSNEDAKKLASDKTRIVDLRGRTDLGGSQRA